jgi:hypothetical protein
MALREEGLAVVKRGECHALQRSVDREHEPRLGRNLPRERPDQELVQRVRPTRDGFAPSQRARQRVGEAAEPFRAHRNPHRAAAVLRDEDDQGGVRAHEVLEEHLIRVEDSRPQVRHGHRLADFARPFRRQVHALRVAGRLPLLRGAK